VIRTLLLLVLMVPLSVGHAADLENDRLSRIQREIDLLIQLTEEAEALGQKRNEAVFRYDLLIHRLKTLNSDIQSHINYVDSLPKSTRFLVQ